MKSLIASIEARERNLRAYNLERLSDQGLYMGTLSEWLSVVVWGGLWGGVMAWTTGGLASLFSFERRVQYVLTWLPAGLLFGIVTTFHWQRAVHKPIVFVTLAAAAGLVLSPLIFRDEVH